MQFSLERRWTPFRRIFRPQLPRSRESLSLAARIAPCSAGQPLRGAPLRCAPSGDSASARRCSEGVGTKGVRVPRFARRSSWGEDTKVHGLSGLREHKQNIRSVFPSENLFVHQSAEPLANADRMSVPENRGFSNTSALPDNLLTFVSSPPIHELYGKPELASVGQPRQPCQILGSESCLQPESWERGALLASGLNRDNSNAKQISEVLKLGWKFSFYNQDRQSIGNFVFRLKLGS